MSTALLRCLFRNLMFYQHSIHGTDFASSSRPSDRKSRQVSGSGTLLTTVVKKATAAVSGRRDHMLRALLLAVKWNQVDFARRMLQVRP